MCFNKRYLPIILYMDFRHSFYAYCFCHMSACQHVFFLFVCCCFFVVVVVVVVFVCFVFFLSLSLACCLHKRAPLCVRARACVYGHLCYFPWSMSFFFSVPARMKFQILFVVVFAVGVLGTGSGKG